MLINLTEEEKAIDPKLGYPSGYAKLCHHAVTQPQGVLSPFAVGPPQQFVPYAASAEDLQLLKDWDVIFPIVPEIDKEAPDAHVYAEELWEQLDHLGNAGFDPAKFRVDAYGNVLYWGADPSSPLSWEVDHWFPHSRGGRTVPSNLQIVQWQARQRKKNRLEFLVPWWDLQHGVSITQFLSTFASKNAEFRRRSFGFFFAGGEDENVVRHHVGDCRPWPPQFRGKKATCGLAGAAIVSMKKHTQETSRISYSQRSAILSSIETSLNEPSSQLRRGLEEDDGLRRGQPKHGPGSWMEGKDHESILVNRSASHMKEQHRVMKELGKENNPSESAAVGRNDYDRQSVVSNTMQKELRLKIIREEAKKEKLQEIAQLEETVRTLKEQNEKERVSILELEGNLSKHKQKVEKQRRWAETQSSYRLCLERMIRDTMHQSISYKEQARLNQAACNALMARLDCQKMTCDVAEKDLLQRYSQREALAALVKSDSGGTTQNKPLRGQDIVDVSSCLSLVTTNDGQVVTPAKGFPLANASQHTSDDEDGDEDPESAQTSCRPSMENPISMTTAQQPENPSTNNGKETSRSKRKAASIGVAHSHPPRQTALRRHFGKELEVNCELQRQAEGAKDVDEPTHLPADDSFNRIEKLAEQVLDVPTMMQETHRQSNVGDNDKELNARSLSFHSDSMSEAATSFITLSVSKPFDNSLQSNEVESPPQHEDDFKGTDELLQEVITTHEDKIKSAESAAQLTDLDDEKMREIGKSNIDKWLNVLLNQECPRLSLDGAEHSAGRLDTHHSPLSPAMSTLSMDALRGSEELGEGRTDGVLKVDVGGLKEQTDVVRKSTAKQTDYEVGLAMSPRADNRHNLRNALKSFEDFKMKDGMLDEHLHSGSESGASSSNSNPQSARQFLESDMELKGQVDRFNDAASITVKSSYSRSVKEESNSTQSSVFHKKSASEDIEIGDWEKYVSGGLDGLSHSADLKDCLHPKHSLRATLKACTLKWKKAAKKLDKPLQEGCIPLQE
ncbi:uncharacterized protein [Physcomitrium patens]|uniref:HNH nuclease domain-containing protein n=1 Tax=Physcomitrium patens TaxID=3218 RepID=A0A2K1IHZ2_PHYPA|nr:uncharacterized protein LOC112276071 isoform X1 [Physcomitrium patens]XP_024362816.1 uncharacterized protein LOC112276071 isoform X1 [Physcomitrium patens]PNR28888.1 hypothetical protein PHYPA_027580 [Physcomitrium patens]|eukprot:XP_024362815.1 uncharacterized protein LOC112276071 isoform X1 [Physcomitrella patens]